MSRLLPLLLLLPGCLSATPGEPGDEGGPDAAGGDQAAEDAPLGDGPDAGLGATGDAASFDAGPDYYDTYIITWTKTGGSCPTADNAMDRATVGVNYLKYESVGCPDVGYEQQGATWNGSALTSFGGGYALENCARDEYEHLPDHTLVFDGDGFSGAISAARKRVSDNGVICTIDLLVEGVRE